MAGPLSFQAKVDSVSTEIEKAEPIMACLTPRCFSKCRYFTRPPTLRTIEHRKRCTHIWETSFKATS